ncbi:hypothetical protein BABINDRAFT_25149, partial [Babjeviella inositovora NRRL Y-12698]
SRRLRLLGYVKSARITTSILNFAYDASSATQRALDALLNETNILKGALVVLYPSYCRKTDDGYVTKVRGWVNSPGGMTKKNRLLIGFARQLVKLNATNVPLKADETTAELYENELKETEDDDLTARPVRSADSSSSTLTSTSLNLSTNSDLLLNQRIAAFIARSVTNLELNIHIGSESPMHPDEVVHTTVVTDLNGHFSTQITTIYKPSLTHVHVASDETIFSMDEPLLVGTSGVSVISDIDDTIKLTGVTGEKRQLFTNVFATEVAAWTIPGVSDWYNAMHDRDVQFHYVSNSPWQLYPGLQEFFKASPFPLGSIHLKQYSGNLINSFMEPLVERKRASLKAILSDFSRRSFICVGDSGEYDFDAYCELAKNYPGQVAAIYIRCVPGTFSDFDDKEVLRDLRRSIQNWKT